MLNTPPPAMRAGFYDVTKHIPKIYPAYVSPKLNGIRAMYYPPSHPCAGWWSKTCKRWNDGVLAHIKPTTELGPLDGELYVHGWPLQQINGAVSVNRIRPTDLTVQVKFHVFDIIDPNVRFSERLRLLSSAQADLGENVVFVEHMGYNCEPLGCHQKATNYYQAYLAQGYEGVMLKVPSGLYMHGRTENILKWKKIFDEQVKVLEVLEAVGEHIGMAGVFVCERENGTRVFVSLSQFTHDERRKFLTTYPPEVKITYLGVSTDGTLLQAQVDKDDLLCTGFLQN